MKALLLVTGLFLVVCASLVAQKHPLVGTWEVVSIKGTDVDGTKISLDGSQFKETKIITPTHYILFTERKQGDSLVFDKAIAGTVRLEGNKYIETPMYYSNPAHGKGKTDFTYRVEGDKFIQSGTFTTPDGKTGKLDELVFKKVKEATPANPQVVGVWNQLSSSGIASNGDKWSHTNATHIRFQIVSPSHWMVIRYKDNAFENAMGGTYRLEGNKIYPNVELSSYPIHNLKAELTYRVEGNKMYWNGIVQDANGKFSIDDVYERVDSKAVKTVAR